MARKLKVFRTPIGFHDAYVAAPSQKAALEAWGSSANLFARGAAEEVTDPALTREPLAHPGEVIRRARGTAAEHLAALPDEPVPKKGKAGAGKAGAATSRPKPKPRPRRTELDAAEAALADAEARHADALRALEARIEALAAEKRTLETEQKRERRHLAALRDEADKAYRQAVADWTS